MKRNVVNVRQSPMNPLRWLVTLDCGHDVWVTRKGKLQAKMVECPVCSEEIAKGEPEGRSK